MDKDALINHRNLRNIQAQVHSLDGEMNKLHEGVIKDLCARVAELEKRQRYMDTAFTYIAFPPDSGILPAPVAVALIQKDKEKQIKVKKAKKETTPKLKKVKHEYHLTPSPSPSRENSKA